MLRILGWIVSVPVALVAISFAVSNLAPVELTLWPLPGSVVVPAFALALVALVLGFAAGGIVAWITGGRHRRAIRKEKARADQAQRDLEAARLHIADLEKRAQVPAAPVVEADAPRIMTLR